MIRRDFAKAAAMLSAALLALRASTASRYSFSGYVLAQRSPIPFYMGRAKPLAPAPLTSWDSIRWRLERKPGIRRRPAAWP